jgi:hypothetical protein
LGAEVRSDTEEYWRDVRQTGIEKRREEVRRLLDGPVNLPAWLESLLEECREEFTPRQLQALIYRYGYDLTHREAAEALGLRSRNTFRKRLDGAERKVWHLRGDVLRENRAFAEFRRVAIRDEMEHDLNYMIPLSERQRRWERAVDRLWGLTPA